MTERWYEGQLYSGTFPLVSVLCIKYEGMLISRTVPLGF